MNDEQVKILLERYDDLRELIVRVNADMNEVSRVHNVIQQKEHMIESKLIAVEQRINAVEKSANGLVTTSGIAATGYTSDREKTIQRPKKKALQNKEMPLKEFLKAQGVEVIDKRSSGGKLWITGEQTAMRKAVELVKIRYGITGAYASGRATHQRPGGYTVSSK